MGAAALPAVARELAAAAGEGSVVPGAAADAVDGLVPRWVVRCRTTDAVAGVVALAHEAGLAVVPRGSGSSLELGAPPRRADILLDLRGTAAVLDDSPDDLTLTVGAGSTLGELAPRLARRGQLLALDPTGWPDRTVGGVVATNASGPLRCRFGTARDLVLGVRFVQADGTSTWGGAKVVKSVTGYDIPKLMVGSLGTLGVLTELTLRLHPAPRAEASGVAGFLTLDQAGEFIAQVMDSTLEPGRLELLDDRELGILARQLGDLARLGPGAVAVAVSFGSTPDAVRAQLERSAGLAVGTGGTLLPAPDGLWDAYERALLAAPVELGLALAPDRIVAACRAAHAAFGDGTGAARVRASASVGAVTVVTRAGPIAGLSRAVRELRERTRELGGTLMIRRGPTELRRAVDPWGPVPSGALDLMRRIKREFDPRGTLNPGRFVAGL